MDYFAIWQQRKEGNAKTQQDTFVPMPYVSYSDRLKKDAKIKEGRNIGPVWLGASGSRPIRGVSYDPDPYKTFRSLDTRNVTPEPAPESLSLTLICQFCP